MIQPNQYNQFIKLVIDYQNQHKDKPKYDSESLQNIFQDLPRYGYIITGFIGTGSKSLVFEAIKGDQKVAIKCLLVGNTNKINEYLEIVNMFQNQINVNHLVDGFYSSKSIFFYYITERLQSDLYQIMKSVELQHRKLPFNQIIALLNQMAILIGVMERKQLFHLDLKPSNILYNKEKQCFCLNDLGMSKFNMFLSPNKSTLQNNQNEINRKYVAPELNNDSLDIDSRADIYSLGLIILELSIGQILENEIVLKIKKNSSTLENILSEDRQYQDLNQIIKQMLIVDYKNRISPQDLIKKLDYLKFQQQQQFTDYLEDQVSQKLLQEMKLIYNTSLENIDIDYVSENIVQFNFNEENNNKLAKNNQFNQQQRLKSSSLFKLESEIYQNLDLNQSSQLEEESLIKDFSYLQSLESINQQQNLLNNQNIGNQKQFQQKRHVDTLHFQQSQSLKNKLIQQLQTNHLLSKSSPQIYDNIEFNINWSAISKKYLIQNDKLQLIQQEIEKQKSSYQESRQIIIECENCNLYDNGLAVISEALSQLPQLRILNFNFQFNQITDNCINKFAMALNQSAQLIELTLFFDNNQITDHGLILLSDYFLTQWEGTNLALGFSRNQIRDNGILSVIKAVHKKNNLTSLGLYFDHNQITDNGILQLGHTLVTLEKLSSLRLQFDNNEINDSSTLILLAEHISHLTQIYYLKLSFHENNFKLKEKITKQYDVLFGKLKHNYSIYL